MAGVIAPPPLVPRPGAESITAELDAIQQRSETEFAAAFVATTRAKNKMLWDAGFDAGVRATLAVVRASTAGRP